MPTVMITKVSKFGGAVMVHFATERDPEFYYAHSIHKEGQETDSAGTFTMWSWIHHMRDKNWWTPELEEDFIKQVTKHV